MQETKEPGQRENQGLNFLNILVIVLSVYVLCALIVQMAVPLTPEIEKILNYIDFAICIFFLFEFSIRFYQARNKWHFMRWGWIDLLSSIPSLDIFRAGRVLRLVRLLRILRAFRSVRHIVHHVYRNRAQGTFTTVAMIAILMVIFSSLSILQVETDPNSNIKTAEDALWWSYVTVTTVGYGDLYPVTTEGRAIAAVLMTVGVGLFGTFTGFLASWFVADKEKESAD